MFRQSGYNWDFIPRPDYDDWKPWHTMNACYDNYTTDIPNLIFTQTNLNTASTGTQRVDMTGGSNGINGFGVQLRWRETDISTASSTGSGSAATNTEAQTTGESQGSSGTSKSSGLSTGGKVGIGIGCAVAGILIILFAIFKFLRSRRLGRQKESQSSTSKHEGVRNTRSSG